MAAVRAPLAGRGLRGRCSVPGDKSISHRAALLSLLASGECRVRGYSSAADCMATLSAVRALGGAAHFAAGELHLAPPSWSRTGPSGLEVDCGRSGTTMRLLAGLLAGRPGTFRLVGDPQLTRRPMARVAEPLLAMGAEVALAAHGTAPMLVRGGDLRGITHRPAVASAQVKSAVLLAGLQANGKTIVAERIPTRDHTERLLLMMGANLQAGSLEGEHAVTIRPSALQPLVMEVPGDASSAAVIAAAAGMVPGSDVVIEEVSLNPTRLGFLRLLARMGAQVETEALPTTAELEPRGSVRVRHRPLRAVQVGAAEIPDLIDELPLVGLLATQAEGVTEVTGAAELRVKESDRIKGLVDGLRALGASAEELPDGFLVTGKGRLRGGVCDALDDHRLAMTFTLAGLISRAPTTVVGPECIVDSFPTFASCLASLL